MSLPLNEPNSPSVPDIEESDVDRAQRELAEMMRSSPIPEADENNGSQPDPPGIFFDAGLGRSSSPFRGSPGDTPIATPTPMMRPNGNRNELIAARRLASKQKLHPYQCDAVEAFIKDTLVGRQVMLFVQQCTIENKLNAIITVMPPFALSEVLMENIKSYVIAVLLSVKLSAYRGSIPCDHVVAIIRKEGLHIPGNIDKDHHTQKTVKIAVQNELTQICARIKKDIKISKEKDQSIYELAQKVISNSQCAVSVPLCARLALLRKMHSKKSDRDYWDSVNQRLVLICTTALHIPEKIDKAFAMMLDKDRKKYGVAATYTIASCGEEWQQSVDSAIEIVNAHTHYLGPGEGEPAVTASVE